MGQNTRVFCLLISAFWSWYISFTAFWMTKEYPFFPLSLPSFHIDHVPKVLYPLTWWEMDEKKGERKKSISALGNRIKVPRDSCREFWLHCAGQEKNVGLNPTQNPKIKETVPFFSPFPLVPGLIETMPPSETLTKCELSSGRDSLIG